MHAILSSITCIAMKNSSSSTLAVKKSARPKKKKSSAASRARKRQPGEEGTNGAVYVGTINGDDGRPATRQRRQELEMREQERNKVEVKQELRMPRLKEGETLCPLCGEMNYIEWGCKTVTCYRTLKHLNGELAYYCGYCRMLSPDGDLSKCKCPFAYNRSDRLKVLANPELCLVDLSNDGPVIPGEGEDDTSRASSDSSSVSEKMGDVKYSAATGSGYSTKTTSEADMNEDDGVEDVVPTTGLSDRAIKIKQEPDAVPSTAFEEETVSDKIPPQDVMSSTATAIPIVVKVKTEGTNNSAAFHEETDVEDSVSSKEDGGGEENDVAAPISQDSQRRKREAAAAEEEEGRKAAPKKRRKVSSTRKGGTASKGKRKSSEDEEKSVPSAKVVIDLSDVPPQPPIPKSARHIKEGASQYRGVSFKKARNKWQAMISIEGKDRHIGYYEKEEEAAIDYARAVFKYKCRDQEKSLPAIDLSYVPPQLPILKSEGNMTEGASKYMGVRFKKTTNKWQAMISIEGKQRSIGWYEKEEEEEAAIDYARALFKYKGQDALDKAREQQKSLPAIDLSDVPPQVPILKSEGYIKEGASRYTGVSFNKQMKKWQAMISIEGKSRYIGLYENEEEAAIDYARAVFKYKGQGALQRAVQIRAARGETAPKGERKSSEDEKEGTQTVAKKKYWYECSADGCTNKVAQGGVCVRHGANVVKRKRCSSEGCKNRVQTGGVCVKHGSKPKRCSSSGCSNQVQKGGVCKRHGAQVVPRRLCSTEGCSNNAQRGGVCKRHGEKILCCTEGCTNQAKKGGVCIRHGAQVTTRKLCSSEGCTSFAQKGGVCIRHGAYR